MPTQVQAAVDELRARCQRAEARSDDAASRADGLRERLARAEEQAVTLRAVLDAQGVELKCRCDDQDVARHDAREVAARLDARVAAHETRCGDELTRIQNGVDDLTREHGFVLEWKARTEEQIAQLQLSGDEPAAAA